jgi:mannitol-1-/sugar-/sorbitol-6-/2-deoxyglucose-6-phosphatase
MTIKGLIFDMDGLLIDSEPLWLRAEQLVFATVGIELTVEMCKETTGVRIDEVVRLRHAKKPWTNKSLAQVGAEILAEVQRLATTEGQTLPGVREVLEACARSNCKIALASSSPLHMIEAVISHLELAQYFSVLCSAADEEHGKPHPAVYLTTAARMELAPESCLAFEDSIPGVLAARAAGMRVVAVPDAHHFMREEFAVAQLKLRSLAEFIDTPLFRSLFQETQTAVPPSPRI